MDFNTLAIDEITKKVQSDCSSPAWFQLSCACVQAGARLPRGALLIGWGPCIMDGVHSEDPLRFLDYLIMRDYQAGFYSILSGFNFDQVLAILPESCIFRSSSLKTQCLQGRRMRGQP